MRCCKPADERMPIFLAIKIGRRFHKPFIGEWSWFRCSAGADLDDELRWIFDKTVEK